MQFGYVIASSQADGIYEDSRHRGSSGELLQVRLDLRHIRPLLQFDDLKAVLFDRVAEEKLLCASTVRTKGFGENGHFVTIDGRVDEDSYLFGVSERERERSLVG